MEKLEQVHLDFLRKCAEQPNKIHSSTDVPAKDLEQMTNEGLLIKYNKIPVQYAISHYGAQYIKAQGSPETPEMKKLAKEYVMGKIHCTEAEAEEVVAQNGVEAIFNTQSEERLAGSQREVKVPVDARGKADIKFRG